MLCSRWKLLSLSQNHWAHAKKSWAYAKNAQPMSKMPSLRQTHQAHAKKAKGTQKTQDHAKNAQLVPKKLRSRQKCWANAESCWAYSKNIELIPKKVKLLPKNANLLPKMPGLHQKCSAYGRNVELTTEMPSICSKVKLWKVSCAIYFTLIWSSLKIYEF